MRGPSFLGILRGEAIKLSRQLSFWLMIAAGLVLLAVSVVGINTAEGVQVGAKSDPVAFAHQMLDIYGTIFQIGSGITLLLVGSRLIAMEYQSGTIRIAYARGVGRLHLLVGKLVFLALLAIVLLVGYLIAAGGLVAAMYASWTGSLTGLESLPSSFWQDFGYWLVVQGMSMGVVILLSAAAAGLGRGLAFAMAGSLAFFPIDNFLVAIMALTSRATRHDSPWRNITEYLLGPNLNVVLGLIEPDHSAAGALAPPLNPIDGGHALLVIGAWALAFLVIAVVRAVRPDVLE
ncbi:MAG TPA: ABC transporter permease [Clostridia bacterium]|nr:ABC transporter permease [Clostridia bacterium]